MNRTRDSEVWLLLHHTNSPRIVWRIKNIPVRCNDSGAWNPDINSIITGKLYQWYKIRALVFLNSSARIIFCSKLLTLSCNGWLCNFNCSCFRRVRQLRQSPHSFFHLSLTWKLVTCVCYMWYSYPPSWKPLLPLTLICIATWLQARCILFLPPAYAVEIMFL